MSQTIQLTSHGKFLSQGSAQVIALDPRPSEETEGSTKYIRVLQISDLLSRHLDIEQVVKIFMAEIADEIDYCAGYRFVCEDVEVRIEQGDIGPANAQYRLKKQNQLLVGELTLFRRTKFNSRDLYELEDLMCALIRPVKNALMYQVALKSAYREVFRWINQDWQQVGQDLKGDGPQDWFGTSVALSDDESIVAVGAYQLEKLEDPPGYVRVFRFHDGNDRWEQLGQDLVGEGADDWFGTSLSLSAQDTTLAVGAIYNGNANGIEAGHVS